MTEVIEEAIKGLEATDVLVDDIAETIHIPNVKLIAGATGVVSLAGGLLMGYFIATKRLEAKYRQFADEEIEEMRNHFLKREVAREPKPDLADLTAEYQPEVEAVPADAVVTQEPPVVMAVPPNPTVVRDVPDYMKNPDGSVTRAADTDGEVVSHYTGNIFHDEPNQHEVDGWDYAVETKLRQNQRIFVIHDDERGEENGWDMTSYTYFAGDDVLCDEADRVLDDAEREQMVAFSQIQHRFGHGSGEKDLVYVRNQEIEQEFEIRRSSGTYSREVMGFGDDGDEALAHAEMPRRRARWDDE